MYGYQYSHSAPDGNGMEFISFMTAPPQLNENDLVKGMGIMILINNKRQTTEVYRCRWERGAPQVLRHLLTLNDEVLTDTEIPALMKRLGIEIEEAGEEALKDGKGD